MSSLLNALIYLVIKAFQHIIPVGYSETRYLDTLMRAMIAGGNVRPFIHTSLTFGKVSVVKLEWLLMSCTSTISSLKLRGGLTLTTSATAIFFQRE